MRSHKSRTAIAAVILVGGALACSSSFDAPSSVTLRVTNTTCTPGPCAAVRVLAFPGDQPDTPGGPWSLDLGVITTPTACVTIPPKAAFYIIAEPGNDTTTVPWDSRENVYLGGQPEAAPRLQAGWTTNSFVPMSAPGWSVDLPGGTQAVPAAPCTPSLAAQTAIDVENAFLAPTSL
jgi:hypothetical protein